MNNKYLILGVNGMAGHMIAQYLSEKGHRVVGFAKQSGKICHTIIGDATKTKDIDRALTFDCFDYVINCIGMLNKKVDDQLVDGIYLNSILPHLIVDKLKNEHTKLIHISTDCVFDGEKGNYTETDIPDAQSYYGRTKSLGEVIDEKNLTIRTSIVGPELKSDGIGLFHWFMSQTGTVQGYQQVIWSGVTTLQLAKVIEQDSICRQTGLYHLVNNQTISKYELLLLFNKYCRKQPINIICDNTVECNKSLQNTLSHKVFEVPSYEQMIKEMGKWMEQHSNLYKNTGEQ